MSTAVIDGRLVREGALPLMLRAAAEPAVLRATRDWTRDGIGWVSTNGWRIRRERVVPLGRYVWVAVAPDGVAEWWADDAFTAMERAEGYR